MDYVTKAYRIARTGAWKEKCSLCDSERKIAYTAPNGKQKIDFCDCARAAFSYSVREQMVLTQDGLNAISEDGCKVEQNAVYTLDYVERVGVNVLTRLGVYRPNEDIQTDYNTVFFNKKDAEEFAEKLNRKEEREND